MTLAIAVATADGLVVAADSRTTATAPNQPARVLSDFTHKVFQAGRCAIATYGFAFLLGRNVAGHMAEFVAALDGETPGPVELGDRIAEFFGDRLEQHFDLGNDERPPAGVDALGFLVGGYEGGVGHLYDVVLPTRSIEPITQNGVGAGWRGQTDVVTRVLFGIDLGLLGYYLNEVGKAQLLDEIVPEAQKMQYMVHFEGMNLQDAIDFATFAIRTTIDVQRLSYGTMGSPGSWPGVGGPIEIAAVTAAQDFQWVQQTKLQGERPAGIAEL